MNERNNFILIEELFFKNLNEIAYNYENVIKKIKIYTHTFPLKTALLAVAQGA